MFTKDTVAITDIKNKDRQIGSFRYLVSTMVITII